MERVSIVPGSVRCLGNIVSEKSVDDFSMYCGTIAEGSDVVNGEEVTVYSSGYLAGASLTLSCPSLISPEDTGFTVTGTLVNAGGSAVSSATVYCSVNGETTTATTNSSGKFTFNISTTGELIYQIHVYYKGTQSLAGCSSYARVVALTPDSLKLYGNTDLITVDEETPFVGLLTGHDQDDEVIGVPYESVDFYECIGYYRLLDKIVVPCESTGTNYCYSIGLDELDWNLSECNWAIEFDFINTVNGGRLCIGDSSSWSSGSGAGDNYIYCGTSTAGNGGYGTKRSGTTDNSSAGAVTAGDTLHYRIVKQGTTINYYLNGTLKGSKTASWITTVDEWSIYLQLWNNGDTTIKNLALDLSPRIRVSPGIVENEDTETLTITLVDPIDGSRVPGEEISVYVDDGDSGLSLVTNKSVLSYSDGESCTLTATLLDSDSSPISGEDVVFKANGVTLDTKQTNSSGVATYTYSAAGGGDIVFSVESYGVSDTVNVADCVLYRPTELSQTGSSGDHFTVIDNDLSMTLPNKFEWTFKMKSTCTGSRLLIVPVQYKSNSNPNRSIGCQQTSTIRVGLYKTTSVSAVGSDTSTTGTEYHTWKITRDGNTWKWYFDDVQINSDITLTWFDTYTPHTIGFMYWSTGTMNVKDIMIKALK